MNNMINLAWMYPDILNLHGERGNAKAFEVISKKMDIELNIDRIDDIDEKIDFDKYDILLFNAGELKHIESVSKKLEEQKEDLIKYIDDGKIIFVTGTSGALFMNNIQRLDNSEFSGLGILKADVKEREMVIGDDIYFTAYNMDIIGSQIQMIDIDLECNSFGEIKYGYGNNGGKSEGAREKNVIFTNALGPVLVKNPWLTECIIKLALDNKKIKYDDKQINYDLEIKSFNSSKEFIDKKIKN